MSDNLITVGTYGNAAEAEIAHAALTEEDIPAFVEEELAATVLPGTAVKLQVPEERVKKALLVLEHAERRRARRLPPDANLPGDRQAVRALLLACIGLILFPVLILLRAFVVVLFETQMSDLLRIQATWPMFALPVLVCLASVCFLAAIKGSELTDEGRKYIRDAWKYNLIVLGTVFVSVGLLLAA
jgi:Putative prokaryotic signal transducing protein